MFNVGGGELIVILLIALIVLGPARLPAAARQVGKTMGDLRRLSQGFQNEMKSAVDTVDDPTRVAARRNVLSKEAPATPETAADASPDPEKAETPVAGASAAATPEAKEPDAPVSSAIAAVAAQPSAPAKKAQPSAQAKAAAKKTADPVVSEAAPPRTES